MLYIFGGLPASGKTMLSKHVAETLKAMHLRIDTIETIMKNAGFSVTRDEGYRIAYAVAEDNLKLGIPVIADSVNSIEITRAAWRNVAHICNVSFLEIEIICSDKTEHQKRAEARTADLPGHYQPSWKSIVNREYELWETADIVIDTAGKTLEQSKQDIIESISKITI